MALTIEITKVSVENVQEGLFGITLNLKYLNDTTVLINQDFTEKYWTGQSPAFVVAKFGEKMQKAINDYKAAQVILNAAALDNAITNLKNGLEV